MKEFEIILKLFICRFLAKFPDYPNPYDNIEISLDNVARDLSKYDITPLDVTFYVDLFVIHAQTHLFLKVTILKLIVHFKLQLLFTLEHI